MKPSTREALIALLNADQMADDYDGRALAALRRYMKPGRVVMWQHGKHERSGVVVDAGGLTYHNARVCVRSVSSGKVYTIPASTVVMYLREPDQ